MKQIEVICNDGTRDVSYGDVMPCTGHGGVKNDAPIRVNSTPNSTQPLIVQIVGTPDPMFGYVRAGLLSLVIGGIGGYYIAKDKGTTEKFLYTIGGIIVANLLMKYYIENVYSPKYFPPSGITEEITFGGGMVTKEVLFDMAMGYRGGAAPSEEMLERYNTTQTNALKKIQELGLQAEFEAYKKEQESMPNRP